MDDFSKLSKNVRLLIVYSVQMCYHTDRETQT